MRDTTHRKDIEPSRREFLGAQARPWRPAFAPVRRLHPARGSLASRF